MSAIDEVRERLQRLASVMSGGRMVSSIMASDDLRALLADHKRQAEELRKVNSGETVSVRFDLSPAAKEGAIRDQLVAMGWTPPVDQQPPHLCDLCRVRKAVRSDEEGIPFCQECWDGWRAKGGEQIADIVAEWEAGHCGPNRAMLRIKYRLNAQRGKAR